MRKRYLIRTIFCIFIVVVLCLHLGGCKEEEDGKFSQINWEFISNDNLEYKFTKKGVDISAVKPGKVELSATNSPYLQFHRIKRDNVIQHDKAEISENNSVYEDEAIRIELSYLSTPSKNGTFTLVVKEPSAEVNYTIDVGLDYLYKTSTINLSIK